MTVNARQLSYVSRTCPDPKPREPFPLLNLYLRDLVRGWAGRWLIILLVDGLRRLHLNIPLSAEIALVLATVVASLRRTMLVIVLVSGLLSVLRRLLLGVIRIILGGGAAHWHPRGPASSVEWLSACFSASSLRDTRANEEEQESKDEDECQRDPSSPITPSTSAIIVLPRVSVVARCHGGGRECSARLWCAQ